MKDKIYCQIRKEWVKDQPEERVRQALISKMVSDLGYPLSYISVEKALDQMPHVTAGTAPFRRADIICFAKGIHPDYALYPLLLIECKANPLSNQVIEQVIGYNYYLQAPFVSVANQKEIKTGWMDSQMQKYQFVSGLPSYQKLMSYR